MEKEVYDIIAEAKKYELDINEAVANYLKEVHATLSKIVDKATALPKLAAVGLETGLENIWRSAEAIVKHPNLIDNSGTRTVEK